MLKSILGLVAGLILGVGGYIYFDNVLTPDATVIEAMEGEVLYQGEFMDADPAHKAMGSFMIKGDGMGGRFIELSNDFQVANAPDPHDICRAPAGALQISHTLELTIRLLLKITGKAVNHLLYQTL